MMLARPRKWLVLITEPNMERKAWARLFSWRLKPYLPEESVITTRGVRRRKVHVMRPMFRGYVFLEDTAELERVGYGRPLTAVGIHKYLMFNNELATVPELVMRKIMDIEGILQKPAPIRGPSSIFTQGEAVRISEGPFSGFTADILAIDDEHRISVLVPFMGRMTQVHLLAEQLEKV